MTRFVQKPVVCSFSFLLFLTRHVSGMPVDLERAGFRMYIVFVHFSASFYIWYCLFYGVFTITQHSRNKLPLFTIFICMLVVRVPHVHLTIDEPLFNFPPSQRVKFTNTLFLFYFTSLFIKMICRL